MTQLRSSKKYRVEINFKILKEKLTIDFVLAVIISIGLFALALYMKQMIGGWIFGEVLWEYDYIYNPPSGPERIWYFETYGDAETYYRDYLEAFRSGNWNPYKRNPGRLDYYVYGPIFIYGLWFISLFVGAFQPTNDIDLLTRNSVKWTALVFDALTVMMLYIMVTEMKVFKERRAAKHLFGILAACFLIFAPMNLYYIDAYYLNIPQMTFFTMVSIFLFMKEKYSFSAYFMTLAWLTKQLPLFLLIPMFLILMKKEDVKFATKKFLFPFLISSFVVSIPWIFITPHLYVIRIFGAGRPLYNLLMGVDGQPFGVTFAHYFQYLGIESLAKFYFYINFPMIPFIFFYTLSILISNFNAEKLAEDETNFIVYITWFFVLIHTFISRGLFKYYDAFFSPFLILTALLLLEKTIQIYQEEKISEEVEVPEDEQSRKMLFEYYFKSVFYDLVLIITFISSIIIIYYFQWTIMITIRYFHPVLLLVMFLILSAFFPIDFYWSIFDSENYSHFEQDIKSIFSTIKNEIVSLWQKTIKKIRKEKT